MATVTKTPKAKMTKLATLWSDKSAQEVKDLAIQVKRAGTSAKADLNRAESQLTDAEELVGEKEDALLEVQSRKGKSWSPAAIYNAELDLDETVQAAKEIAISIDRMKEIIAEWL